MENGRKKGCKTPVLFNWAPWLFVNVQGAFIQQYMVCVLLDPGASQNQSSDTHSLFKMGSRGGEEKSQLFLWAVRSGVEPGHYVVLAPQNSSKNRNLEQNH